MINAFVGAAGAAFVREARLRGCDIVRLHDLRHTFASRAVMEGVPLAAETVGKRIGKLVGV